MKTEYQEAHEQAIVLWQSVACPACGAKAGDPCTLLSTSLKGSRMLEPHLRRRDLAEWALKGNLLP